LEWLSPLSNPENNWMIPGWPAAAYDPFILLLQPRIHSSSCHVWFFIGCLDSRISMAIILLMVAF